MQTKRKTIGRMLSATTLTNLTMNQDNSQRFILKSGKSAMFHLVHVPAVELESKTFVRFLVNGRDQTALTPESLIDITRTIKLQQFFPAIGYRINNKIEILDGSRRRAAALLCNVGLSVLVSETEISSEDARQLAIDIQTAKEHNLREIGLRLLELRNNGMTQKEIALLENMSAAKVTRAIQAASVPEYLILLFPVQSELNYADYKVLLSVEKIIKSKLLSYENIVQYVNQQVKDLLNEKIVSSDELKSIILKTLKNVTENLAYKKTDDVEKISHLWLFDNKNTYARKRIKDRGFSYEFNRVPKQLQEKLDLMINQAISDFFEHK